MKAGVDALLGYRKGDGSKNVAFSTTLPTGRYLILGVGAAGGVGAANRRDAGIISRLQKE